MISLFIAVPACVNSRHFDQDDTIFPLETTRLPTKYKSFCSTSNWPVLFFFFFFSRMLIFMLGMCAVSALTTHMRGTLEHRPGHNAEKTRENHENHDHIINSVLRLPLQI